MGFLRTTVRVRFAVVAGLLIGLGVVVLLALSRPTSGTLGRVVPMQPASEPSDPFEFVQGAVDTVLAASNLGVMGYGSFVGGGDWTGVATSAWYRVSGPFKMWISGFPTHEGNELRLEFRDKYGLSKLEQIRVTPGQRWISISVDPPAGGEFEVRILARDRSGGPRGWLGFSPPFTRHVDPLMRLVQEGASLLRAAPGGYSSACFATLIVFAMWTLLQGLGSPKSRIMHWFGSWVVHVGFVGAVFVSFRWPYTLEAEINADESVEIAEAIKMFVDPRYWVSVDGYTHGPVVTCAVMLPAVFGLTLGYGAIRWLSVVFWMAACVMISKSLSYSFGRRESRIATFPLVVALASATAFDFVTFNCEPVVLFFLALGCLLGVKALRTCDSAIPLVGAGLSLGLVPYAKLQGVPMAAALALAIASGVLVKSSMRGGGRSCWGSLLLLVGSGLAPTLLVALYLISVGALDHFVYSYIVWNLAYAARGSMDLWVAATWVVRQLVMVPHVMPLSLAAAVSLILAVIVRRRRRPFKLLAVNLAVAGGMLVLGVFVAAKPGNTFHHYVLLALLPGLALLAVPFAALLAEAGRWIVPIAIAIMAITLLPVNGVASRLPWLLSNMERPAAREEARRDVQIAESIAQFGGYPETLVVWGWMSRYHVLTGMPPATQHNFFDREMQWMVADDDGYFYRKFLKDFERAPPRVFVDAVVPAAFAFKDRSRFGHEAFPELAAIISRDFKLVDDIEGIRVYVRYASPAIQ